MLKLISSAHWSETEQYECIVLKKNSIFDFFVANAYINLHCFIMLKYLFTKDTLSSSIVSDFQEIFLIPFVT